MAYIGSKPADKALTSADIEDGTIALADLSATGTKDATTFLRGDNTFASAGGANTPAFEAYLSSGQFLSQSSDTKIQFNAELFDTDNCYDNATNYRFTPTTAGKYFCYTNIANDYNGGNAGNVIELKFYKNGSAYSRQRMIEDNSTYLYGVMNNSMIIDFNGTTDYLEIYVNSPHGTPTVNGGSLGANFISNFGAYKIIE